VRLKAKDTLNISAVKPENILPGEEFDMDGDAAQKLLDRKLVDRVKEKPVAPEKPPKEDKPAPENKGSVILEKKD
jgi:hypothetical protein